MTSDPGNTGVRGLSDGTAGPENMTTFIDLLVKGNQDFDSVNDYGGKVGPLYRAHSKYAEVYSDLHAAILGKNRHAAREMFSPDSPDYYLRDFAPVDIKAVKAKFPEIEKTALDDVHLELYKIRDWIWDYFYTKQGVEPGQDRGYDAFVLRTAQKSFARLFYYEHGFVKDLVPKPGDPPLKVKFLALAMCIVREIVDGEVRESTITITVPGGEKFVGSESQNVLVRERALYSVEKPADNNAIVARASEVERRRILDAIEAERRQQEWHRQQQSRSVEREIEVEEEAPVRERVRERASGSNQNNRTMRGGQ